MITNLPVSPVSRTTTKMSSRAGARARTALLFSKLGYRSGFRARSRTFWPPSESAGRSRVSRLCLFPRDTSRRDNGSFPFLDDDGETTVVNGNPFGDVNAKFPHSAAAPCLNNKEPGVAAAITATAATSKCASGESRRVFVHAKAHLFPLFFSQASSGLSLCRIAFFYFIVEKTNFLVPKLRALPRSGLAGRER